MKVYEDNEKEIGIGNGRYRNVRQFQAIDFGRTLFITFRILNLVFGGLGCGKRNSI